MSEHVSPSSAIDQVLRQAVACHRSGEHTEAERLYRSILANVPDHPDANHNLGLLAVQLNRPEAGLLHLKTALENNPENGRYWLSYIEALMRAGYTDSARQVLQQGRQAGLAGEQTDLLEKMLLQHQAAPQTDFSTSSTRREVNGSHTQVGDEPSPAELEVLVRIFNSGNHAELELRARDMTRSYPRHPFVWKALGMALQLMARPAEALLPIQTAVQLNPGDAEAHCNLGNTLQALGRPAEAEVSYRQAITLRPDFAEAHCNLGNTLQDLGRLGESEASYRQAISLRPDFAETHNNLGNILRDSGRLAESETSYRQAIMLRPDFAEAHCNLGHTLQELGRLADAEAGYRQAIALKPDFVEAYNNLGNVLRYLGRLAESETSYRQAITLKPDFAEAHCNLGHTLQELGRLADAETSYRRAIMLKPDYAKAYSNLLLVLNYTAGEDGSEYLDEARKFGLMAASKAEARFSSWRCAEEAKRLRVGLVSGDLRNHPVGYFLENILAHLDQSRIELLAYPTSHRADELTDRIRPYFSAWTPLSGLPDEAAARLIHEEGVHVLLDLAGHTAKNRLPVFAWKPAPVQVSWLGYSNSTGLAEMDYYLGDPYTAPLDAAAQFTEALWRLPESYLCFTPPPVDITAGPLPARRTGRITFGCFNNLSKVNDQVLAVWSQILRVLPNACIFLRTRQLKESSVRERITRQFAGHGVTPERVILEGWTTDREEMFAAYRRVDIALDPFPYNGTTTSVESLWMGVPVITKQGHTFVSRVGESILHNAGLAGWIAQNEGDYVAKAVQYASDLNALEGLRSRLRDQVLVSPLFDAPRFAGHFESALRGMWENRLNGLGLQSKGL